MKRPTKGSSVAGQETRGQQEESRYMEHQEVDRHGAAEREDVVMGAYDEEDEDEELAGGAGERGAGGLGEKKRRLAAEQVRALERNFEVDNKLDPERKARIARDLRLHPRQVAVWFQNRRARWKTKRIEREFAALRASHDNLRHQCDSLRREKDALAAEIRELREKVEKQMAVKLDEATDERPAAAAASAAAAVYKDGSMDSDSSAVFNEEASPYSGTAFDHHQRSFTGFTSFLASSSALSSSFTSLYHGSYLDKEYGLLGAATDELGGASFFSEEHAAGLSWYGSEGW